MRISTQRIIGALGLSLWHLAGLGQSQRLWAQGVVHSDVTSLLQDVEATQGNTRSIFHGRAGEILTWAAQHRPPDSTVVAVGRLAFALVSPLSHPDSVPGLEESRWRFPAVRLLRRAARASASPASLVNELERAAPYPRIWEEPEAELAILRRAVTGASPHIPRDVLRAYLGMELEQGDPVRARHIFLSSVRQLFTIAEWQHWNATLLFAMDESDAAAAAYFEGAAAIADSADIARYEGEMRWIASPRELSEWKALVVQGYAHRTWLIRFWSRHDLLDGRMPGTRLREQFARWRLALHEYRWDQDGSLAVGVVAPTAAAAEYGLGDIAFPKDPGQARAIYDNRSFSRSRTLDDRGFMVMRHGRPDQTVSTAGITALTQELLRWSTEGGEWLVSFSRAALAGASMRFGMLARNYPVGDLTTLCRVDTRLCALAANRGDPSIMAQLVVARFTRMREVAEASEGNPQRFAKPLGASVQVYGLPGGNVLVVASMLASPLQNDVAGALGFSARLRVVVGDSASGRIVTSIDTLRRWRSSSVAGPGAFLNAVTVVPAPPGIWRVSVVVSDSAGMLGSGTTITSVPVIALGAAGPQLSDPILGRAGSGVVWRGAVSAVALNPGNVWPREDPSILSVTADGLTVGAEYSFTIEVWESGTQAAKARLKVSSSLRADSTTMFLQRVVSFKEFIPGEYRIVLGLRGSTEAMASTRERLVTVKK